MSTDKAPGQYNSPLREAQANQTSAHILETMTDILASGAPDSFSVKRLADAAGVSERTVYRYFPDRTQLMNALSDYITDAHDRDQEGGLATLDELAAYVTSVWARFDEQADITRAAFLLNPDPRDRTPSQISRTDHFVNLASQTFPHLTAEDQVKLGQLARTITSTFAWMQFRDEFGVAGGDAGELVGWALSCVVAEVRRTGQLGPDQTD